MAGKKQHYIPQALLRGFLINEKGNDRQTRVYKKGQAPYPSSVGDIAATRYFYSDPSSGPSKSLDDRITDYENRLGPLLKELRTADDGHLVDPIVAAEVVAHLSIRGAYLREIFSFGVHKLIDGASTRLKDEELARSMFGVDEHAEESQLTSAIDEQLSAVKDHLPDGLPVPLLRRMLLHFVREEFGNIYGKTLPSIQEALENLVSGIPSAIRDGHGNALSSGLVPDKRVADLATLSWRVYQTGESLLLPDCVAISIDTDGATAQPYALGDVERIDSIMLPLSSNRLLIGRSADSPADEDPGRDFNLHAAGCSTVFFVSAERSDELLALSETIGSIPQRTISALVAEALDHSRVSPEKSVPPDALASPESAVVDKGAQTGQTQHTKTSYRVSFKNCATREVAEEIAASVGVVVNELATSVELNRLDEIIFAEDYAAAVNDLDRGYAPVSPMETIQVEELVGVARTVVVNRDGERKVAVVMRSWIGHALLSDEESAVRVAAHMLTTMLSEVAFQELLESSNVAEEVAYTPWESLFYAPMSGAVMAYYAAWMGADIDPTAGSSYRSVFLSLLNHANTRISVERLAYGTHGDLDVFLRAAMSVISDMLISMAKLIGHSDARNEPIHGDDESFLRTLSDASLCGWASLYGRDLRRAFSARGSWRSMTDLTSLSCHMERQLWRFFVFPWIDDEGQIRVEVPYMGEHKFGS